MKRSVRTQWLALITICGLSLHLFSQCADETTLSPDNGYMRWLAHDSKTYPSVPEPNHFHEEASNRIEKRALDDKAPPLTSTSADDLVLQNPSVTWIPGRRPGLDDTVAPSKAAAGKTVVIGTLSSHDTTSWVTSELVGWQSAIYTVDDPTAPLHTPVNKGREALPYLTYIITHYHALPPIIAFVHDHRSGYPAAWHNDNKAYSNVLTLDNLKTDYLLQEGYVNLRCNTSPGCPTEMRLDRALARNATSSPSSSSDDKDGPPIKSAEAALAAAWPLLFPSDPMPPIIAAACCAQFAVSRAQVLARPRADYERYRNWLLDTELEDNVSGRVFEYLWHVIFGREAVFCPRVRACYCDVFGQCGRLGF